MADEYLTLANAPELPSGALPCDGRRRAIVPADVHGRFQRRRGIVFALLISLWASLPWITIGGHPAVLLDVAARQFFLFGLTFNAQDTWLLFFLLTGVGFGLVFATALAGRVWCGWACPHTVFLEGVYRRLQRLLEGSREKRLRRDAGPWTMGRIARKGIVHGLYLVVSFFVAHILLSYFTSLPAAFQMIRHRPTAHPEAFAWALSTTGVLYLNFAWFREQLCVVLCPYGRLQSALVDEHSLVVGYDAKRGEPRGKKGAAGAGDCVDCKRCVVVCPTGIDIRNGLQMECVACTACIDACDAVMDKLGRARGLVRYDSQDGLSGKPRRVLGGRVVLYSALLLLGAAVFLVAARGRTDFEVTLLRLPGEPYTIEAEDLRNALQIHLVNKRPSPQSYRIDVEAPQTVGVVLPMPRVTAGALSDVRVPIFLSMPRNQFRKDVQVQVRVARVDDVRDEVRASGTFLGPSR